MTSMLLSQIKSQSNKIMALLTLEKRKMAGQSGFGELFDSMFNLVYS